MVEGLTRPEVMALESIDSHYPMLIVAVMGTSGGLYATGGGPVLEMGIGWGSTPLLHRIVAERGRRLVSLESNPDWARKFATLADDLHTVEVVPRWEERSLDPPDGHARWAVAFVDHAPGERRVVDIERLRQLADYIVVHDTEAPGYGWAPLMTFRYRYDYTRMTPWTSIVSDACDPRLLFT